VWNGYGVFSNLASSGEPPASHDHYNHWRIYESSKMRSRTVTYFSAVLTSVFDSCVQRSGIYATTATPKAT